MSSLSFLILLIWVSLSQSRWGLFISVNLFKELAFSFFDFFSLLFSCSLFIHFHSGFYYFLPWPILGLVCFFSQCLMEGHWFEVFLFFLIQQTQLHFPRSIAERHPISFGMLCFHFHLSQTLSNFRCDFFLTPCLLEICSLILHTHEFP